MPPTLTAPELDAIIERYIAEMDATGTLTDSAGIRLREELRRALVRADKQLEALIDGVGETTGGLDGLATPAAVLALLAGANTLLDALESRIVRAIESNASRSARDGLRRSLRIHDTLNRRFGESTPSTRGIEGDVLPVVRAGMADRIRNSIARYRVWMLGKVQTAATNAVAEGSAVSAVKKSLERIFIRRRGTVTRAARTEVTRAANWAIQRGTVALQSIIPDMGRKILATFDSRTAYDSIGVHGQVRGPNENFIDGAGREYLYPPARPNDREVTIPWRLAWPETTMTRPRSAREIAAMPNVPASRREAVQRRAQESREQNTQSREQGRNEMRVDGVPRPRLGRRRGRAARRPRS
jgi:hypothetical protein